MALVVPDVSSYQTALTSAYPRDFLIFRCCDGDGLLDVKFLPNANEVAALYKAGRIKGAICYQVYRPVDVTAQYNFFWKAMGPTRPAWLKGVMLDVESWGGAIRGDHSTAVNQLAGKHAAKMGYSGVIGYGNQGDLKGLWPKRDPRIRVIVAAYTSSYVYKNISGAIGQQYTDGSSKYPVPSGLPRSTVPFGNCDHNVFPAYANGAALAAALQPTVKPPVLPPAPVPGPYSTTTWKDRLVDETGHVEAVLKPAGDILVYRDGKYVRTI